MKQRSNGEGMIRKRTRVRKDGTVAAFWEGRIMVGWLPTPEGGRKPDVRTVYGSTRQEVIQKLQALKRQADDGKLAAREASKLTVKEYLTSWLEKYRKSGNRGRGLAENTVKVYHNVIHRYAIPAFGHLRLSEVKPQHLVDLYAKMADQGLSVRMRQIVHRVLHNSLQQAVEEGLLGMNPADRVPRNQRPTVEKKKPDALDADQVRKLIRAAAGTRWALIFWTYLACGLRRSELLGLQWQDVDFERGILRVRRQALRKKGQGMVLEDLKTERSRRDVPIPQDLLSHLLTYYVSQGGAEPTAFVFPGDKGPLTPETVWQQFRYYADKAGVPRHFRLHDLRHTAGTLWVDAGIPLNTVADLLGHSDVRITADYYVKTTGIQKEKARQAMQQLLGKPEPAPKAEA